MKILQAVEITKSYGIKAAVNRVCLEIHSGEIVGLLGQNGAGKSTVLSMLVGMIKPDHGKIFLKGTDITDMPMRSRAKFGIGPLIQNHLLIKNKNDLGIGNPLQRPLVDQNLTVEDNIFAELKQLMFTSEARIKKLSHILGELGLTHLAKKKAFTLSIRERKRLEIAKAISSSPDLIILDEPFSLIDPLAVDEIQDIILRLKEKGMGILLTDHNVRAALSITDHSYILDSGSIITAGTTNKLLEDPLAKKSYFGEKFLSNDIILKKPI